MRNVIVTGGASGIGKATVALAKARGWNAISLDRREADIVADLSRRDEREQTVAAIHARFKDTGLDGVIACAGLSAKGNPPADAKTLASVNYFGTTELLRGLQPLLKRSRTGRAVAFSSTAALHFPAERRNLLEIFLSGDEASALAAIGDDGSFAYVASKAALSRWVRREAVTVDWAGAGILLNAVAPGATRTPMIADLLETEEGRAQLNNVTPTPVGYAAEPADLAEITCFLVSSENRFIVGQTIFCDGGAEAVLRPDGLLSH